MFFYVILFISIIINKKISIIISSLILLSFAFLIKDFDDCICIYKRSDYVIEFFIGMCIYKIYFLKFIKTMEIHCVYICNFINSNIFAIFFTSNTKIQTFRFIIFSSTFTLLEKFMINENLILNFLIKLGNISFSTYLCHIPIFLIYQKIFKYNNIYIEIIGLTCTTIIISFYSYRFIENNILIKKLKVFHSSFTR